MFGPGGIYAELMNDSVIRRCPFTVDEARAMIETTRLGAILNGARGRPVADIDAAAQMLSNLSRFAASAEGRLKSIDLNPVVILDRGKGAVSLDALLNITGVQPAPNGGTLITDVIEYEMREARGGKLLGRVRPTSR